MRARGKLPGVLSEEGEVVEDGTKLGGFGGIDAGVVGGSGSGRALERAEVVADVPGTIAVGGGKVAEVDAEFEAVLAACPAEGVDVVELTLVVGGIVADVVVGGAVVEGEGEDGGLDAVGGVGLEEIGGGGWGGAAEVGGDDGCGALGVRDVEAEVVHQRRRDHVGGASGDGVDVGDGAAVGGAGVEVEGAVLRTAGWSVVATDEEAELGYGGVVEAHAAGVEGGGIGEGRGELAGVHAGDDSLVVGQWIGLEQREDDGGSDAAGVGAGDDIDLGFRDAEAKAFVGEEEEELVLDDGAANDAAEVILLFGVAGELRNGVVIEPVVGIEDIVAEVFEGGAVEAVGAAARDDGELGTGGAAVLGVEGVGLDLVFLHIVDGDEVVVAAIVAGCGRGAGAGGTEVDVTALGDADVGADAVDGEVVASVRWPSMLNWPDAV